MTWGFSRDGGLPWSDYFAQVNDTWKAPIRSLWLQGIIVGLVGVLYTFSTTALEAILSVTTIALTVSYAMPILTLLLVGRDKLPPGGEYSLGRLGPAINIVSVVYCAITTVFFLFPGGPNPPAADMNYAIAVFGVMLIVSVAFWFIKGSSTYLRSEAAERRMAQARQMEVSYLPGVGGGGSGADISTGDPVTKESDGK